MPNRKVVHFPNVPNTNVGRFGDDIGSHPDLFGHGISSPGFVTYLPVEPLTEHLLLLLVVRNGVRTVFDLRPRPVFDRPLFNHQRLLSDLYGNGVTYYDVAADRAVASILSGTQIYVSDEIRGRVDELLNFGLTVCIYDEAAKTTGWLDRFRQIVRMTSSFKVEFNPRGLVGL